MFGAKLCVHYWEVVLCSEGPLSEVPLYIPLLEDLAMLMMLYMSTVHHQHCQIKLLAPSPSALRTLLRECKVFALQFVDVVDLLSESQDEDIPTNWSVYILWLPTHHL